MRPALDVAREFLEHTLGPKGNWPQWDDTEEASLASLIERERAEIKREIHQRIRETMMHPTVKDVPIPQALWHLMRNLEHETGDWPIGALRPDAAARGETPGV